MLIFLYLLIFRMITTVNLNYKFPLKTYEIDYVISYYILSVELYSELTASYLVP